ncbi:MAG: hypothetical protein IPP37_08080 [Saprospiraceae bacterium]|nr:hypothetical protein [Saprospiraceae bacterium]
MGHILPQSFLYSSHMVEKELIKWVNAHFYVPFGRYLFKFIQNNALYQSIIDYISLSLSTFNCKLVIVKYSDDISVKVGRYLEKFIRLRIINNQVDVDSFKYFKKYSHEALCEGDLLLFIDKEESSLGSIEFYSFLFDSVKMVIVHSFFYLLFSIYAIKLGFSNLIYTLFLIINTIIVSYLHYTFTKHNSNICNNHENELNTCNAIAFSIPKILHLELIDWALIYFVSLIYLYGFTLVFSNWHGLSLFYFFVVGFGAAIALTSIMYQIKYKLFCRLCILIDAFLLINILLILLIQFDISINYNYLIFNVVLYLCILIYFYFDLLLLKNRENISKENLSLKAFFHNKFKNKAVIVESEIFNEFKGIAIFCNNIHIDSAKYLIVFSIECGACLNFMDKLNSYNTNTSGFVFYILKYKGNVDLNPKFNVYKYLAIIYKDFGFEEFYRFLKFSQFANFDNLIISEQFNKKYKYQESDFDEISTYF